MAITTAVILAGGLGTRLRSALPDLPKAMAPIAGRPFLEYQMNYWIAQGISRFVLSVGYRHEAIVDYFGHSYGGAEIDYAVEVEPLGTGGGLLLAFDRLPGYEPFLILNGDTYFAVDLKDLARFFTANDADWCFSLFRAQEVGRYMGLEVTPDGRITSLNTGTGHIGRLANGGVYCVHPRALRESRWHAGEKLSLENDMFGPALASGQRMFGLAFPGTFIDIGVPSDYYRAADLIARKKDENVESN